MNFAFSPEQEELRASARAFLAEHSSSEAVRRAMASERGYDEETWKRISAELGWTSVAIPEAYGGAGLGAVELVALAECMGEALLCAPFLSSVALAANALLAGEGEAAKQAWLPALAEGRTTGTLAFGARRDAEAVRVVARRAGSGWRLDGEAPHVLDGATAELLVVPARQEGSSGADGIGLFAVPASAAGIARRPLVTMDATRRLAHLVLDGVQVPDEAVVAAPGAGFEALEAALDRAAVALAAEQVGGAQRCLDLAVAYAKERVQFGRPIGSFQAIKHKCADLMLAVETARSAAWYAGCVAAEGGDDLAKVASLAKAWASEAYFRCAAEALQIHGGVGFTWEYDVHLHLKRARAGESFLGTPAWHRERVAARLGL